jgi:integrative and conjugative element protein (TIGR02256 family)
VLAELIAECERIDPCETGGVLLGYWGDGTQEPVITHSVGPGPDALHEPVRFRPDQPYQLAEIASLYESSERTIQYLGDWHSHPSGSGGLSTVDRRTLRRIARCRTARAACPLMLVLAGESAWEPTAWIQERVWRWWCFPGWKVRQLRTNVFDDADERQ